jgi:succinate dehydrogenase/fumarate reductase flavoprotein subunit
MQPAAFWKVSLLDIADMVIRASLESKESRLRPSDFFRTDFPKENNDDFFAFSGIQQKK